MKRKIMKMFNKVIIVFLLWWETILGITSLNGTTIPTTSPSDVSSDNLANNITQNASRLGVNSQIDFKIESASICPECFAFPHNSEISKLINKSTTELTISEILVVLVKNLISPFIYCK